MSGNDTAALSVRGLRTRYQVRGGAFHPVDGVSFDVPAGGTLALVGESGCGKSATAASLMRLLPRGVGRIVDGSAQFDGVDLASLPEPAMRRLRGHRIAMVFQEPMTSLNPVHTVGAQIVEALREHLAMPHDQAWAAAVDALRQVGIPAPEQRAHQFPHQLSGGMRQRVVIAIALACNPSLLIADEPTTALDVTVQAQILELFGELQRARGLALLLITHDLAVVAEVADRVAVMYAGRIVEQGTAQQIFDDPQHPYTVGLLSSIAAFAPPADTHAGARRFPSIAGRVPDLRALPGGCRYAPRCPYAVPRCREEDPPDVAVGPGHVSACWRAPLP